MEHGTWSMDLIFINALSPLSISEAVYVLSAEGGLFRSIEHGFDFH